MLLSEAGTPIQDYGSPGFTDHFAYPDGELATLNPIWEDAADTWPGLFDTATIADGVLNATGYTVNTWPTLADHPNLLGRVVVAVDLADIPSMAGHTDDDYSVTVIYDTSDTFAVTSQISPCGFVDFNTAGGGPVNTGYREMGVKPVYDVSVVATYMQTVFRPVSIARQNDYQTIAEGDDDDYDYYDYLSSTAFYTYQTGPSYPRKSMTFRARNGQCRAYLDGTAITPVISTPAWAVGRTKVGLDIHHIHFEIGQPVGPLGPVDHVVESLVTGFYVTPFSGTL